MLLIPPSGKGLGHRSCREIFFFHTNLFHLMLLRFNATSIIVLKKEKPIIQKTTQVMQTRSSVDTHIKVERDNVIPELEYVHPLCQEFGETMCLEHQNY